MVGVVVVTATAGLCPCREFDPDLLSRVSERRWVEMMKCLKRLVVAYDNMPSETRHDMATFREVVMNMDWLVIMSFHAQEVEERRREEAQRKVGPNVSSWRDGREPEYRRGSDDMLETMSHSSFGSRVSASEDVSGRRRKPPPAQRSGARKRYSGSSATSGAGGERGAGSSSGDPYYRRYI